MKTTTKLNLRKALLAGTAIVAVGAFATGAQAVTLTGNAVLGTGEGAIATGVDIELDGNNLLIEDADSTTIGAITDTNGTPNGTLTVQTDGGGAITQSIGSVALGTGTFLIDNADGADGDVSVTVTGTTTSTSGALTVSNSEATGTETVTATFAGNMTIGGITTINTDGTGQTGVTTVVNVDGASNTFTGAVGVTGGAAAASNSATLALSGAATTFSNGLAITRGAGGDNAFLNVDGTVAQTVTGAISGNGTINVSNITGAVTFAGDSIHTGTLNVNGDDVADQSVIFSGANASAIVLGEGTGTETITATFSGTNQVISGGITSGAGETTNIVVSGSVDQTAVAWVSDTVAISSGATLQMNQNVTADSISGAGTLDVDTSSNFVGSATSTNLSATTVTVADSVTLTVDANTNSSDGTISSAVTLEDDGTDNGSGGTLAIDATGQTVTVSGAITTALDKEGSVTIVGAAGATALTADVGTSSASLQNLTVAAATAGNSAVSATGNLYVDAISIGQDDIFTFAGTTTQTVSGTFVAGHNTGAGIVIGDGATQDATVTFVGAVGGSGFIDTLTVNDGARAIFQSDATFDGALSADAATIDVAHGKTATFLSGTDADVTTWNIDINKIGGGAQTNGSVVFTNDVVNLAVDTVNFEIQSGSAPLTVGASVLDNVFIDTGANGDAVIAGATVTDNSYLYGFELVNDVANDAVDVTVTLENSIASTVENSGFEAVGDLLITGALAGSTNTEINLLQSEIQSQSTASAANDVIEAVASDVSGGGAAAGLAVSNQTSSINSARLASLRDGSAATGMAAGNGAQGLKVWGQAFGSVGDQDARDGVSGYDIDTYGLAVGVDTENLGDNMVVGLAFAYADTEVDSDGIANANTEIDSYQVTLYGDYDVDERTYLSGQIGYTWSDVDTTRNPGGLAALTAKGDYDSNQINARVELGRDYQTDGGLTLTPSVLANYVHYDADSYTETGASGANLTVDADALSLFEIGVGVDAAWKIDQADGSFLKPVLSAGVRHDLIGDEFEASNQFAGGGSAFKVKGFDPAQTTFDVGAGVTYFTNSGWDLTAEYDFEFKSDYNSHAGLVKASYNF